MTQYLAYINVPGYLPMSYDPPVFDTAQEAWAWLAQERERDEDDFPDWPLLDPEHPEYGGTTEYTETMMQLQALSGVVRDDTGLLDTRTYADMADDPEYAQLAPDGTGSVVGATPGYVGDHDLGLAYTVEAFTADPEFVAKLEAHDAGTRTEHGQPVHYASPEARGHMNDMLALPIQTSRDATTLVRSNWRVIQKDLTDQFPDDIEDHRFAHWAVGWIERLYVRRGADVAIAAAQKWVEALEQYPVASDDDLSDLEYEEIQASIGDYLASGFALNLGTYGGHNMEPEAAADVWSDDFGYAERETVLRYLFDHNERLRDYYPEHNGTDVNWDTDLIEEVVTEWLLWVLDRDQHPDVTMLREVAADGG